MSFLCFGFKKSRVEIVEEDRLQPTHPQLPPQLLLLPALGLSLLGDIILGHLGEQLHSLLLCIPGAGHLKLPHFPHHDHFLTENAGWGHVLVTRVRVELTNRIASCSPEIFNVECVTLELLVQTLLLRAYFLHFIHSSRVSNWW